MHTEADISLSQVDVVLVVAGGSDEDNPYKKSTAFQVSDSIAANLLARMPIRASGRLGSSATNSPQH